MVIESIKRIYSMSDANMIQFSKGLRLSFIDHQSEFIARKSSFASPFEVTWNDAIVAAETAPIEKQRKSQLQQLTCKVEEEMILCRDVYQVAKFYILEAFANQPGIRKEFGLDEYKNHDKGALKLIGFMTLFHATAVKYAAQLTDPKIDFTQAQIDELETRRGALNNANDIQEKFKGTKLALTEQRINILNDLWKINRSVMEMGKRLFRKTSYAKYKRYVL